MDLRATRRGAATLRGAALAAAVVALAGGTTRAETPGGNWVSKTKGLEVRGLASLRIQVSGGDEIWYASVLGRGVCSSEDRGKTWKAIGEGIEARASSRDHHELTLDPKEGKVLYDVVRGKIYKTEDAGATWRYQGNGTVTRSFDRRHAREWVAGVAVDPSKPAHLLAGTRTRGFFGGLFESVNGGTSWTQIAGTGEKKLDESGLSHDAWPIALDPRSDKFVVVGGARGSAWASEDRGRHFKRTDPGGPGHHTCYDLLQVKSREVLLAETRGLYRSRDGGDSWGKEPLLAGPCIAVDVDPANPKRAYAIVRGKGIFHTEDVTKWTGEASHAEADPHDVVCHPKTKNVVYVTSQTTGLWESTDRGETFAPIASDLPAVVPGVTVVAAHPADPRRMLAADEHGTTFLSQDGGETWSRVGSLAGPVSRLLGEPGDVSSWLAAGRGVYRSVDLGATWSVVREPPEPTDRAVDLQHTPDALLVLWERDGRVECSRDLCKSWLVPATRPSQSRDTWAQALAVDPRDPKHWIVATRSVREEWSKDDPDGGAFETFDEGATWTRLSAGVGAENGNQGIVAAIDGAGVAWYGADGGGLFRRAAAKDAPWEDVTPTSVPKPWWFNAFLVAAAPGGGSEVVLQAESAGSEVRSLVRSTDDGKTWTAMESPEARLASLSVDPKVPGRYLAGDVSGDRGVLVYQREGAPPPTPPAPPAPAPGAAPPSGPGKGSSAPAPSGLLGVSASRDGSARLFDARSGKSLATLAGPSGGLLSVAVSPDGSAVFAGGADRTVVQWDPSGTRVRAFPPQPGPVTALAVSPDGSTLYAGDAQWGIERYALGEPGTASKGRIEGHAGAILALAVSPDGRRLFSGSADGTLRTWDALTGAPAGPAQTHESEVHAVAVSGDGATVWSATRSPTVRAFDAATGEPRGTLDAGMPAVFALAAGPDGALYAAGAGAGVVRFGSGGATPVHLEGPGPVLALASSADGAALAGGADGAVRLFPAGETKAAVSLPPHAGPVTAVALAPLHVEGPPPGEGAPPAPPAPPAGDAPAPAEGAKPEGPPPAEPPPPSPPGPAPSNPPAMG